MTKPNVTAEERPYHHGDLHSAIVNAALAIMSETQSTEFSLRELARRAGVSHNAPYKHFSDKRELLTAVSAMGFEFLAERMTHAMKRLSSPRARLSALARTYVRHGVENPALYGLMFGGYLRGPDDGRPVIERAAAEKTKALIAEAIVQVALGRAIPNTPRKERKIAGAILMYWSLMHGLTLLLIDRLAGPMGKSDELSESMLQGMLDGFATNFPALPLDTWVGARASEE